VLLISFSGTGKSFIKVLTSKVFPVYIACLTPRNGKRRKCWQTKLFVFGKCNIH
jgi:hypothetical protein